MKYPTKIIPNSPQIPPRHTENSIQNQLMAQTTELRSFDKTDAIKMNAEGLERANGDQGNALPTRPITTKHKWVWLTE